MRERFCMNNQKMSTKTAFAFQQLGRALDRFDDVLKKPADKDDSYIDASMQRFEFCIELFWKALKRLLADLGKEVNLPKLIMQEAYQNHLINDEQIWLDMLKDRNQTSHTYDEDLANQIYAQLPTYAHAMRQTYNQILKQFNIENS